MVQVAIASLVIVAGTWVSVIVARQEIAEHAMQEEVDYFWQQRAADPAHEPPDESRLRGYAVTAGDESVLPQGLRGLGPGMHALRDLVVMVDERGDTRLVLAYPRTEMNLRSVKMVAAPLVLALLALMASALFTYRNARRIVAPLDFIARSVRDWDPMEPDPTMLGPDRLPTEAGPEARQLAGALQRMAERMRAFVRRERDFTRDASHELRTPLTVIRVASDLLAGDADLPERARRSLARIQGAGRDMESVIDAFLILAREGDVEPQREDFAVRDIVAEEAAAARALLGDKPVELVVTELASPVLHAAPRVLAVMVRNLLSNACTFTERGRVEVRIEADRIVVADTGIGMSADAVQRAFDPFYRAEPDRLTGKGMGLSIVRRLGDRFGWPVVLDSQPGRGTVATIRFGARD
jgi:signal transduction histidine kinase